MVKLKLIYQGCVRKFQLQDHNLFASVKSLVSAITQDKFTPTLQYLDEDDDWITISTEADLLLCFQTMNVPKIHILNSCSSERIDRDCQENQKFMDFRSDIVSFHSAMDTDYNESKIDFPEVEVIEAKVDVTESKDDNENGPFASARFVDWNVLVEDLLTTKKEAIQKLVKDVYEGLGNGKDLKTVVMSGISESSFSEHPFISAAICDLTKMLEKTNHMSMLLLQVGKDGLEMAVPLIMRGYAKMKAGENDGVIDLVPVFKQLYPQMTSWLESGLGNGQEATFDLGQVMRLIAKQHGDVPPEPKKSQEELNAAAAGIVIHKGITCDICNAEPIIGVRYKCMTCLNFDMCEFCRRGNHPPDHPLITLQAPVPRGGFKFEEGHLKGATEFFKPKWMQGRKCENIPKPNASNGPLPFDPRDNRKGTGFRGKGWCRRGDTPWRRWSAGPPFGPVRAAHGLVMVPPELQNDFDSTTSSSSSSSADEYGNINQKEGHKKMKKRLRKLKKKERKIRRGISKLMKDRHLVNRSMSTLQRKELVLMNKIAKLTGTPVNEKPLRPPTNNPGHDPNPNTRPFEQGNWRSCEGQVPSQASCLPQAPPSHSTESPNQSVRSMKLPAAPETEQAFKYAAELQVLVDMGFYDITVCKQLLEQRNGNVNEVAQLIGNLSIAHYSAQV